jgi:hypothetical protein
MVLMKRSALATTLLAQDDAERAERMFEEGLASARRLKSHSLTYVALYHPAQLAMAQRDLETAANILGEAMGPSQQTKDSAILAGVLRTGISGGGSLQGRGGAFGGLAGRGGCFAARGWYTCLQFLQPGPLPPRSWSE